jgi:hypothetical protein
MTEFNSLSDAEVILKLIRAGNTTVMGESPQYFLAFRHVLGKLQVCHGIRVQRFFKFP